jgi:hypothetical protein
MGERAAEFSHANPVSSAGFTVLLTKLDDLIGEAKRLGIQQLEGIALSRGATMLKRSLQREIRLNHLGHLVRVAQVAAEEQPEVGPAIRISQDRSQRGFRTTASTIAAAAQANRDLLLKHGMADSVVDSLIATLEKYDQAVLQSAQGRRQHVGASADLDTVADEIVQVVRLLDGYHRLQFGRDPELMAAWESASSVVANPQRSGEVPTSPTPAPPGDVRPAA